MDTVGALVSEESWVVSDVDKNLDSGSEDYLDGVGGIQNRQALIENEKNRALNDALDQRIDKLIGGIVEP